MEKRESQKQREDMYKEWGKRMKTIGSSNDIGATKRGRRVSYRERGLGKEGRGSEKRKQRVV